MTPSERVLRARMGGHAVHARHNTADIVKRANCGFKRRFEAQVRAEAKARGESLSEDETAKRAKHAMKLYMTRLALKSAKARRSNS